MGHRAGETVALGREVLQRLSGPLDDSALERLEAVLNQYGALLQEVGDQAGLDVTPEDARGLLSLSEQVCALQAVLQERLEGLQRTLSGANAVRGTLRGVRSLLELPSKATLLDTRQ